MAQRGVQFQQSGKTPSSRDNNVHPDHPKSKTSSSSLFRVLQDRFKPNTDESDESTLFRTKPAVNRPQVLTPSSFGSDRLQRLNEKKDCAFHWTTPHADDPPPPPPPPPLIPSNAAAARQHPTFLTTAFRPAPSSSGGDPTLSRRRESIDVVPGHGTQIIPVANGKSETGWRRASVDVASLQESLGRWEGTKAGRGSSDRGAVGDSTPMGRLMRAEVELTAAGGKTESNAARFGVSEFLELYRSRAYSDPRLSAARRAAASSKLGLTRNRRRRCSSECDQNSECSTRPTNVSSEDSTDDGEQQRAPLASSSSSSSSSRRRLSGQSGGGGGVSAEVPDTIPEHTELDFVCRRSDANNNDATSLTSTEDDASASSDCGRRRRSDRRYSEPPILNLQELSRLSSCFAKTQLHARRQRRSSLLDSADGIRSSIDGDAPLKTIDLLVSPESLGIDTPILSRHHLIVWKDNVSTQVIKLPASVEFHEALQEAIVDDENSIYAELMEMHSCSELMPRSSKVVLLDVHVKVVTALRALTLHAINSAPLWDSNSEQFVGLLTVTDFIRILQLYRNSQEALDELEGEKISSWKGRLKARRHLVYIGADDSISEAVRRLGANRIHRLPVFDESKGNMLYFLSYRRILQFICLFMNSLPRPQFMNRSIWELNVGTFESIASIGVDRPLYEAFDLLIGRSVSALPVVDDQGRVIAVYAKADAVSLANDRSYRNLNTTVGKALSADRESFEGVYLCKKTDSLSQVVEWMVRTKVHRLIVADADHRCEGIVSVSDVVRFLVLNPPKKIEHKEEDVHEVKEGEKGGDVSL